MENKTDSTVDKFFRRKENANNTTADAVYGLGFIGAAIYYISIAATFGTGVLGFLKAIIWPVFLVLETLKFLGA